MPDALSILLNAPDRVLAEPGWATEGVLSHEVGCYSLTDCWVEPSTGTVLAMPLQMTPDYQTSASGDLARLRLADYEMTEDWEEYQYRFNGDWFLSARGSGKSAVTNRTWANNQAFWLAFYVPGRPSWDGVACEFRFGNARNTGMPYTAKIHTEGQIELLEGENVKWTGWVTGRRRSMVGQMVTLMVLPFRRNSILFWSNQAGSAIYEDPDISDISDGSAVCITTGTQTEVSFPETRGVFQLMGLKYKTDFTMSLKEPVALPYAPTVAPDTSDFEWDTPPGTGLGLSMLLPDGSNAVYDGAHQEYKWEITGTGTADATPFIYRCPIRFPATNISRTSTPVELAGNIRFVRRIISRNPARRFLILSLRNPGSYPSLESKHNRSLAASIGTNELFKGLTLEPRLSASNEMILKAQDLWKRLERTVLVNTRAYDGELLIETVRDVLARSGFQVTDNSGEPAWSTEDIDMDGTDTTRLPRAARDRAPLIQPKPGQSAADFLLAIHGTFCRDWSLGFQPTVTENGLRMKFCFHPPEQNPVSQAVFYLSTESAQAASSNLIARDLEIEHAEPAANEIRVLGTDAFGNHIEVIRDNPSSWNSELPEEEREANWIGERWISLHKDSFLVTQEAAEALADRILAESSEAQVLARWTGPLVETLWPGTRITLENLGDFELLAMDTRFELESADPYRPTRYLARRC